MLDEVLTSGFKRDYKKIKKQHKNLTLLREVVNQLKLGETLDVKYKDHQLSGDWVGSRECHITPDWLLIYEIDEAEGVLNLIRTGSHSELFESVSAVQKLNQSLDEVLFDNVHKQEPTRAGLANINNLCKRSDLGTRAREMLQPENLIGPFESHDEMMKSLWGDDDE